MFTHKYVTGLTFHHDLVLMMDHFTKSSPTQLYNSQWGSALEINLCLILPEQLSHNMSPVILEHVH